MTKNPPPSPPLGGVRPLRSPALRIGVMFGELRVAERFLPVDGSRHGPTDPGDVVTIGHEPRNTLMVPWEAGLSRRRIFLRKGGKWHLIVSHDLQGQLVRGGKAHELAAIREAARSRGAKAKNDLLIPLDGGSMGRVQLGDARLLFQFGVAPPPVRRPPFRVRLDQYLRRYDWNYVNAFVAMVALQLVGMMILQVIYPPQANDGGILAIPNVTMVIKEKPSEPPVPQDQASEAPSEKVADAKAEPTEAAEDRPVDPDEKKAVAHEKVMKQTIIRYLAAVTTGDNNNIVSSDQLQARFDQAFDGTPGLVSDSGQSRTGPRFGSDGIIPAGNIASIDDDELGRGGGAVDSGEFKEAKISSRVRADAADEIFGAGTIDKSTVAQIVQRRLSAIKACYERELKSDPDVAGKVVIQFTIEESGRVSGAKVLNDSTGEPRIGQCVANVISRFKFPQPVGGSVTASYPFVFSAGT